MADEYDYLFKSIVVGDGGVGKTALTLRFSKGFFTEDYKMTIGVDFHVKTIKIDTEQEGTIFVKLQIWDTGGQERFSSIRPMYYRGALGALLIFDLTSYESFEHLPQWIEEVRANVKSDVPLLLLGNKQDLVDLRAVSVDEINDFTKKFNLYYMETSAKTGEGVGDCFYILACLMVGSGVPEQLISKGIVYGPGQIHAVAPATVKVVTPQEVSPVEISLPSLDSEPELEFSAPPVPELKPAIEPEPELEFSAPPVPEIKPAIEPEPELEFSAPPVPDLSFEPAPSFEPKPPTPVPKMEIPAADASEIEFKTPDQILGKETEQETTPSFFAGTSKELEVVESPSYKPKAIPFTSSIPVPVAAPEEFQSTRIESESLVDFMPETILSKKDKKKLEKQKKKEAKEREKFEKEREKLEKEKKIEEEKERIRLEKEEKLREKKEKAAKVKEEMQRVGKEKKKKEKAEKGVAEPTVAIPAISQPTSETGASTFFQTISQKGTEPAPAPSAPFVPFKATVKTEKQLVTEPMAIPNIADIIGQTSAKSPSTTAPTFTSFQQSSQKEKKKEIVICKQCGAMLSTDYQFCNKCGAKL